MREMTREEIIHDLQAIADFFIEQSGGCVPIALEAAIKILKGESEHEDN